MNMKIVVLVLLGILVIMSFVQGMQINALEKSFEGAAGGITKAASNTVNIPTTARTTSNVPAMVGGC